MAHHAGSVHFGIGIETIFLAPPKDKKTLKTQTSVQSVHIINFEYEYGYYSIDFVVIINMDWRLDLLHSNS